MHILLVFIVFITSMAGAAQNDQKTFAKKSLKKTKAAVKTIKQESADKSDKIVSSSKVFFNKTYPVLGLPAYKDQKIKALTKKKLLPKNPKNKILYKFPAPYSGYYKKPSSNTGYLMPLADGSYQYRHFLNDNFPKTSGYVYGLGYPTSYIADIYGGPGFFSITYP